MKSNKKNDPITTAVLEKIQYIVFNLKATKSFLGMLVREGDRPFDIIFDELIKLSLEVESDVTDLLNK